MKMRTPFLILVLAAGAAVEIGALHRSAYAQASWNWGELAYSRTYPTKLEVPNDCPCSVLVTIEPTYVTHPPFQPQLPPKTWTKGNPYLTIPNQVVIPPGGGSVPATIKTPPAPPIPRTPQGVALNDLTVVEGELKLTAKPLPNCCNPRNCETQLTYKVDGHIHLDPGGGGGGGGGGGSGREPVDCDGYWDDGEEPPESAEEHCRDRLRQRAQHYVETELAEDRAQDPGAWSWLPSAEAIAGMTSGELLEMRARAEAQRGR